MDTPRQPDWNHIRAFLATAEEGSLSGAAKRLGLTQPTLSRQIASLEQTLGVLLFERLGRSLALTDAGRDLLVHSHAMGAAAEAFSRTASGQSHDIEGLVKITASDLFSLHLFPQFLTLLRERAPKLEIEIVAANDIRDLMRREADIAIRHVRPEQPELIARLVHEAEAYLYASDDYLRRYGTPKTPEDCATHEFISFGYVQEMCDYLGGHGVPVSKENFRLSSHNGIVAWDLVQRGFGIAFMWSYLGDTTPGMRRVLPELPPAKFPFWLTTHRELHTSKKIRLVFDTLDEVLSGLN